jgi:arylsulfatase A-like enzyme
MFTRMYAKPAYTPNRVAVITVRHPVRNGMGAVGWPLICARLGYGTEFSPKERI